jgi:hypothetical protein
MSRHCRGASRFGPRQYHRSRTADLHGSPGVKEFSVSFSLTERCAQRRRLSVGGAM